MKRMMIFGGLVALVLGACAAPATPSPTAIVDSSVQVTVFKSPS